jgi:hypothetical protein
MSTQFDPRNVPQWGGLPLGIALNIIPAGTTAEDIKEDREKRKLLVRAYRILDDLGVGKINGKYVDTLAGLEEKRERKAAAEAAARAEAREKKAATKAAACEVQPSRRSVRKPPKTATQHAIRGAAAERDSAA